MKYKQNNYVRRKEILNLIFCSKIVTFQCKYLIINLRKLFTHLFGNY